MKKISVFIVMLFCVVHVAHVHAQKINTEPCLVEALVFSGVGKHQVYIDAAIPDQGCDHKESAILDPEVFGGTSVFTNLQLASIFRQEIQLVVDGCIDAKDIEGPVKEGDEKKTFPRITDVIFYSGMKTLL